MTAPIVIVGAGLAGLRTAEELRRAGYAGALVLVGEESRLPYDRPPLSKQFVRGETDDTTLRPSEFYDEKQIELRLGTEAVGVDTAARRVRLADGTTLDYDQLIVATGLRPRRLPGLPDLAGVHVLRGHSDAVALRADLTGAATALVVGAGFIGCELAASFRAQGVEVVLVEPQATPLASVLATLNAHGFHIVYSSALVRADMKLRAAPRATRLDEFLREILAPWTLSAIRDA